LPGIESGIPFLGTPQPAEQSSYQMDLPMLLAGVAAGLAALLGCKLVVIDPGNLSPSFSSAEAEWRTAPHQQRGGG
jgi:hypothetical protein